MDDQVWVFASPASVNALYRLPSGVFTRLDRAEAWISENRLTGILMAYPVDRACIDWALENLPKKEKKNLMTRINDARFVAGFSSELQEHYLFVDGQRTP